MPEWTLSLILTWTCTLLLAVVLGAAVALVGVRIWYTRRALAAVPAEPAQGQAAAPAVVGRARVTNRNTGLAQTHLWGGRSAKGRGLSDVPVSQPSVAGWETFFADHPAPGMASAQAQGANDYRDAVVEAVRETVPPAQPSPDGLADLHDVYDEPDGGEAETDDADDRKPPASGGNGGTLEAAAQHRYQWGAEPLAPSPLTGGGLPYVWPHDPMLQAVRPIRIRRRGVGVHYHHPGAKSLRKVFGHRVPPRPADRIGAHREERAAGTVTQQWGLA